MGYTSIAQTPVVTGLYTVIFPTVVFALLGSSRLLVVGRRLGDRGDPGRRAGRPRHRRADAELGGVARLHQPHRAGLRRPAGPRAAAPAGLPGRLPVRLGAHRLPHRRRHPGAHRPDPRHARGSRRARAAGSSSSGHLITHLGDANLPTVASPSARWSSSWGSSGSLPRVPGRDRRGRAARSSCPPPDASGARRRGGRAPCRAASRRSGCRTGITWSDVPKVLRRSRSPASS